ncbi:unnamed protein product [Paramecium pentaurelia]|uniref:Myb-like DNA-binding domain containing protein n=1 Tax=Paramecium pentaurelia TaxID=43138 RepID=A0A8S1WCE6_9CILI|nr:unnamed protein product [Paramecium pentaurelia]
MSQNSNSSTSQRKPWTPDEDRLLAELKKNKDYDWIEVARRIEGRNPSQCSQRWKRIKGFKLRRTWTTEEDEKLLELINVHNFNWCLISTFFKNRSGKQVREHYLNQLDPQINTSPWSIEEDKKIVELYQSIGGKWSVITKQLNSRSENSVKNRFYSCLRHKYLNIKNPYYIVPEKKQKLNEEDSYQNQNFQEQQNITEIQQPYQHTQVQQALTYVHLYENYLYQVPIYMPQPILVPVYIYPSQFQFNNQ